MYNGNLGSSIGVQGAQVHTSGRGWLGVAGWKGSVTTKV